MKNLQKLVTDKQASLPNISPVAHALPFDPAFFELFMDRLPNMVFVKDAESRFLYANRALLELFHPDKRHLVIGYTTAEDFSSEEATLFLEEDRRAFANGYTDIVEEIVDYKGETRVLKTQKTTFRAENGALLMLGECTDISALAGRERELVEANAMLENFAALAAHDLRTPLSTFIGCVAMIQRDPGTVLSPTAKTYAEMMERSANNLAGQISGLLSTYRAQNRNAIDCASTDLNLLFEEVKFNLREIVERTKSSLISNRLPTLGVDTNLFRHLVMNLLENSIKYRDRASPVIVFKFIEAKDGDLLFTVEDNGIGIRPENEKKVFKIYEQIDGKSGNGVGLGLSLCKNIVELHGGKIWIDHDYKNGCKICFTIRQPV